MNEIGKTLDTIKSGGNIVDVTLVSDDVPKQAHKVNKSKSKESESKTDKDTIEVTLVSDDEPKEAPKIGQRKSKEGEDNTSKDTNEDIFVKPARAPNDKEKKKMLAKTVEIMIVASMENHVYQFGNVLRRQKSGGPIGLALTGEIADCYMINWDKKFLEKLKSLGINLILYMRFKDDTTIVTKALERGSKFENGKIVIDEDKKKLDEEKSADEVTIEVIKEIAESIDDMIEFTVDFPSNKHKCGKLPILDIQVCVNKNKENRIDYEFYEKPTKHNKVVLSDSAISSKQKRTILTQECLRRLRNTKIELGRDVQIKYLNQFMLKLKNSGYSTQYRKEILDSAEKAFEKMVKDDQEGIKPLFRSRNWNIEERKKQKENKKVGWYKNAGNKTNKKQVEAIEYKTVLFVPVTKGGCLMKELKKREEEINKYNGERIKIVEDGGIKLKDFLIKKGSLS